LKKRGEKGKERRKRSIINIDISPKREKEAGTFRLSLFRYQGDAKQGRKGEKKKREGRPSPQKTTRREKNHTFFWHFPHLGLVENGFDGEG